MFSHYSLCDLCDHDVLLPSVHTPETETLKAFYSQDSVLYSGQVHIKVTHRVFINVITVVINCVAAAAGSSAEVFNVNTTEKGRWPI